MNNVEAHGLAIVLSGLHNSKLSAKTAYAVARNTKALEPVMKAFVEDRAAIVRDCSELDEAGDPVVKDDLYQIADMPAFETKLKELHEREVSVELAPIAVEDLGQITPNEISALMPALAS